MSIFDKAMKLKDQVAAVYTEKKADGTIDATIEQGKGLVQLGVVAAKAKFDDLRK